MRIPSLTLAAALLLAACSTTVTPVPVGAPEETAAQMESNPMPETATAAPAAPAAPTAAEAAQFVNEAEAKLATMNVDSQRASWVQADLHHLRHADPRRPRRTRS